MALKLSLFYFGLPWGQGNNVLERAGSCAFSVSQHEMHSCASSCLRHCNMASGSSQSWSTGWEQRTPACWTSVTSCSVPLGGRVVLDPIHSQTEVYSHTLLQDSTKEFSFVPYGESSPQDSWTESFNTNGFYVVRRYSEFSNEDLKNACDPYRILFASVLMSNRLVPDVKGGFCQYVYIGKPVSSEVQSCYTSWNGQESNRNYEPEEGPGIYVPNSLQCAHDKSKPSERFNPTVLHHLPNIASSLQGWFLKHHSQGWNASAPNLVVSIIRSYPFNSHLESEAAYQHSLEFSSVDGVTTEKNTDVAVGLEIFLAYGWTVDVNPLCAQRTGCGACLASSRCSWCDMSDVPVDDSNLWVRWQSMSKTGRHDGSACGVPPTICSLMGGKPNIDKCSRVRWDSRWTM